MPGGEQGLPVVHGDTAQPAEGEHPLGGPLPIHRRHAVGGVVGEVGGELRSGRGLHAQVHLDAHGLGEDVDRPDQPEAAKLGLGPLHEAHHRVEQLQVAGEGALDAGAQYLDRDLLALVGDREVDLRDRGGRDRLILEVLKHLGHGPVQLGLDRGARLRAREGRQAILQVGKVGRQPFAHEVGAGREELTQLDEAGAQLDERAGQLLPGPALGPLARHQAAQPDDPRHDAQFLQGRKRIVPGEAARDHEEADEGAQGPEHEVIGATPNAGRRCHRSSCGNALVRGRPLR